MPRPHPFASFCLSLICIALLCPTLRLEAKTPPPPSPALPLLPLAFDEWRQTAAATQSASAANIDAPNASALAEYGFRLLATALYANPAGSTLRIRAMQFPDATGAYGAFTFYRQQGMSAQDVGSGAAFGQGRALFWQGNILVEAESAQPLLPQLAAMRALAAALPKPVGNASVPPPLPAYLPQLGLQKGSERYTLGPAAYAASGGILPPALAGFELGTEAISANYTSKNGSGLLTILSCPTTQLAAQRERAVLNFLKAGNSPSAVWPPALAASAPSAIAVHRSGPLVSITSGQLPAIAAQRLAESVLYQANVTWNHPQGYMSDAYRAARLYLAIFALVGILGAAAVLLGLFLGGGRALIRVWQGKPASTMHDVEFIRLNLRD